MLKKLAGVLVGAVLVLAVYGAYVTVKVVHSVATKQEQGYTRPAVHGYCPRFAVEAHEQGCEWRVNT